VPFIAVDATDALRVAVEIAAHGDVVHRRVVAATFLSGQELSRFVKAHASGRPGPNAPTGQYRSHIPVRPEMLVRGYDVTAELGVNDPQARRLEYGFHDTDSLGRVFEQGPYPHWGPGMDDERPIFEARLLVAGATW
jgi:hypothetical protein